MKPLVARLTCNGKHVSSGQAVKNNAWIWENSNKEYKIIWEEGFNLPDWFFADVDEAEAKQIMKLNFFPNYVKK